MTDPTVAGGLQGISIDGFFGGSGLGRIGSPDFLPKFQHTNQVEYLDTRVVAARQPHVQGRRRHHRADAEPLHGRAGDARRAPLPERVHRQPDGRLPARLRVGPAALERLDRRAAPLGVDVLRAGRLEGQLEADGEPRPALRLHHAGARGAATNRRTSIRPAAARSYLRATGRSKSAGSCKPDRNNWAPRISAAYKLDRPHHPPRRLGHLLQPLRSRRQRGSARAERAGPREQQHHADLRRAGVLPAERVAGELPQRARPEPGQRRAEAAAGPRGRPTTRRRRRSTRRAPASSTRSATA